jgi:hypothetical protein
MADADDVAEALAEGDYDEEAQAAWDAQHEDEEEEEEEDEGEPPRVVSRPWDGKLLTKLKHLCAQVHRAHDRAPAQARAQASYNGFGCWRRRE